MHRLDRSSCVLLTGATGLIGGEIVRALLDFGIRKLWLLVRPQQWGSPRDRVIGRMRRSGADLNGQADCVRAVAGDMRKVGLGLTAADAKRISGEVDFVIHCAAQTSFARPDECFSTNIGGMRILLDLVHNCKREPLVVFISTAASCGAASGACLSEDARGSPDGNHYNEYTRSKAVAERILLDSGLPALVVRPSIVLSAGLPDRAFARAILWFIPLLQRCESLPVNPRSRLDIVPVDFVAKSLVALLTVGEKRWNCYHFSAGPGRATTCEALARFIDEFYRRPRPLRLVRASRPCGYFQGALVRSEDERRVLRALRYYLPFLNMDVVYDNSRLRNTIGAAAINIPDVAEYLGDLLQLITNEEAQAESLVP